MDEKVQINAIGYAKESIIIGGLTNSNIIV